MSELIIKKLKRYNYLIGETEATYHEISLKLGLSDSAMKILYAICDNGKSCLLQEICRSSGMSKQTVNSAIRKLENEGIVYLENVGQKAKNVCLTESGKELVQKTALRVIEIENSIFESWREEDVEFYLRLTEQYLVDLKRKIEELL
ncbi:MAG: winged helix-turn-helix transcriptional regulator [Lachnospiraceae bacterium]|nr:winged helix-turn-helix transcriptional regulator [Lachnospiraceae bacterium]